MKNIMIYQDRNEMLVHLTRTVDIFIGLAGHEFYELINIICG